jgi:Ca2+-binding RTX toxin-like protein
MLISIGGLMRKSWIVVVVVVAATGLLASSLVQGGPAYAVSEKTSSGELCTIVGTAGRDTLKGKPGLNDVICGLGGDDVLNGLEGNDILDGGAGNDTLNGGAGNDILLGAAGNDTLNGGAGNDILLGAAGADVFNGGTETNGTPGSDTVSYSYVTSTTTPITAGIDGVNNDGLSNEKDNIKADVENIVGSSSNDTLTGSAAANTLTGGPGSDTLNGGPGSDTLNGGPGSDTLNGGAGNDQIKGSDGDDSLIGGDGNDALFGELGRDGLAGGAGNDALDGGPNSDNLDGGSGSNTCTFSSEDIVSSSCDSTAPVLESMSLSRSSVNTSTGAQTITVTVRLTDDLTGVAGDGYSSSPSQVTFTNAATGQIVYAMFQSDVQLSSGTRTDGVYTYTMTVPYGAAHGAWDVSSFLLVDQVGNMRWLSKADLSARGLPTGFTNG